MGFFKSGLSKTRSMDGKELDELRERVGDLVETGRPEEALRAYREALEHAPDDLELLRDSIEFLVIDLGEDREALEDAIRLSQHALELSRRPNERELLVSFELLAAMAFNKLGEAKRALALLDEAQALEPDDPEIGLERGISFFELLQWEEARAQLSRTLAIDGKNAWAHYYLGLVLERADDEAAAGRHFARARRLAPDEIPPPVELSAKAFDRAVEDALARLPPKVRGYLANVSIRVQALPREDDLRSSDPPLSPESLGMFSGTPVTEVSSDPWSHFPSSITLYQRNLQRFAATRDELIEEIDITLLHEVGHFLGLSEDDLYERGLD
jgi:predicted Zn-dependent protease with MMP-like domain